MPDMRRPRSINSGMGRLLCFLPLLVGSPVAAQVEPCSNWACDSMVVRTILDANGLDRTVYNVTEGANRVTNLYLDGLDLTSLPAAIGRLDSLRNLDLGENQLTDLPPEIGELRALTSLNLNHNKLTGLPSTMGQLANLDVVFLDHNHFAALPPVIGKWTLVKQFRANHNRLKSVPAALGEMSGLYELWLDSNELAALPPEIGKLEQKLQRLDVSHNALETLPDDFGRLAKMLVIILNNNRIKRLPLSMVGLKPNGIILHDNRLCDVPDTMRTWIDKHVLAFNGTGKKWMESQRLDDDHACDGTVGTSAVGSAHRASRFSIDASAERIVLSGSLPFSCAIYDWNGVRVFQSRSLSERLEIKRQEPGLPAVKKGVYIVRFKSADGIHMQKLMIP